ncbi:oxidoreductase [Adhaeribacter aquaticus]|uniref:oxidoreductase n=1 Tax=Adhaeribacter aquaticus TaxID=299567 RepID=UPI0003FFC5B6|nr:oxidoreductase [Adhaeribacter aquaticus]
MTSTSSFQPITVGIASYGMSGMVFHAPFISSNPKFKLRKIVQRSGNTAQERYPDATIVRSYEELLQDESLELIIVNVPNSLHLSMTRQALEAGKHVIVEKPFTVTSEEAQTLIEVAKANNRLLSVYQNRRWDGDFMTVQQVVQNELLGKLVDYEAHYDRYRNYIEPNTWKEAAAPGTGILYNLGSHMIDQALVLFGKPNAITAEIGIQREGGQVDDYYHLTLHYLGLRVTLKSSYLVREQGPRYILHGTEGSFLKYGLDPQEENLKVGVLPTSANWGMETEETWGHLNTQLDGLHVKTRIETLPGNYRLYYDNIYEAIREDKELQVKPEQSLLGIQIIEAALQSNAERRTVTIK